MCQISKLVPNCASCPSSESLATPKVCLLLVAAVGMELVAATEAVQQASLWWLAAAAQLQHQLSHYPPSRLKQLPLLPEQLGVAAFCVYVVRVALTSMPPQEYLEWPHPLPGQLQTALQAQHPELWV